MKAFVAVASLVCALIAAAMLNYLRVYYPAEASLNVPFLAMLSLFVAIAIWGIALLLWRRR